MKLQVLFAYESHFNKKVANVVSLVSLELNYFAILRMIYYSTVTSKLLNKQLKIQIPSEVKPPTPWASINITMTKLHV